MIMNQKIILASASPRRRELLAQIGLEFEVKVSNKEEVYTSVTRYIIPWKKRLELMNSPMHL